MRPAEASVVCLPHPGKVDQLIESWGQLVDPAQLSDLEIRSAGQAAVIGPTQPDGKAFVARLRLTAAQVQSSNLLPVEFRMTDFRRSGANDARLLGACVVRFRCSPVAGEPAEGGA